MGYKLSEIPARIEICDMKTAASHNQLSAPAHVLREFHALIQISRYKLAVGSETDCLHQPWIIRRVIREPKRWPMFETSDQHPEAVKHCKSPGTNHLA
jgi:hypothetical protein